MRRIRQRQKRLRLSLIHIFWGGEEIEGEFCVVTEAGEFLVPYTVRVEAHRETEEENYAYFISADPIEPLPEEKQEKEDAKPVSYTHLDEEEAAAMLRMLSGNTHMVYTGVAVIDAETKKTLVHFAEGTEVTMYPMTEQWIRSYVAVSYTHLARVPVFRVCLRPETRGPRSCAR